MCLVPSVKRRFSYLKLNICLGPDGFGDKSFLCAALNHRSPVGHLFLVGTSLAIWGSGCFRRKGHAFVNLLSAWTVIVAQAGSGYLPKTQPFKLASSVASDKSMLLCHVRRVG